MSSPIAASPDPAVQTFPWRPVLLLTGVGFLLRFLVGLQANRIYHADEICQVLEQGHRLAFGYGFIPWEYCFGIRCWAVPGLVAGVLKLTQLLHVDRPGVYVPLVKAMFCAISCLVIPAAYQIGSRLASRRAGWLAAVAVCGWYELVWLAHKPLMGLLGGYFLFTAAALALSRPGRRQGLLLGICAGLVLGIRLQLAPAVLLLGLYLCWRWRWRDLLWVIAGGSGSCLVFGLVDWVTWGMPFCSYFYYVYYNQVQGVSRSFGTEPVYFYAKMLFCASGGLAAVAVFWGSARFRRTWPLLALGAAIVGSHTLIAHKEYRFVLAAVPLWLSIGAIAVAETNWRRWRLTRQRACNWVAASLLIGFSVAGLLLKLPGQKKLVIRAPLDHDPVLDLLQSLSRDPNVAAVAIDQQSAARSGFYHLHREVPFFGKQAFQGRWFFPGDLSRYVSHVIQSTADPVPPGFTRLVRRQGNLVVLARAHPASPVLPPPFYTRFLLQRRIYADYQPPTRIRRFLLADEPAEPPAGWWLRRSDPDAE